MTWDQRSRVNGCGVTRDPFPSDPSTFFFPHPERLGEEARVCEVVKVYTPLKKKKPRKSAQRNENLTGKSGGTGNIAL